MRRQKKITIANRSIVDQYMFDKPKMNESVWHFITNISKQHAAFGY